jgi:hypothetical protein
MKCLRIYADESGESHLADIDIPLAPIKPSPFHFSAPYEASSVRFVWAPTGMPEAHWHIAPARQLVILLNGWLEFETSDGEKRRCERGTVILAEDTFGKGHLTRGPGEPSEALFVAVPDGLSVSLSSERIKC